MAIGTKYQTYQENNKVVYRLVKYKNTETAVLQDVDNPKITRVESINNIKDKFVELESDAILDIMITSSEDEFNDVYVCVYRKSDIASGSDMPALILRQDIYSYTKNAFDISDGIYVGECVTEYDKPSDLEKIADFCEFAKVDSNLYMDIYIDDTLDDIINLVEKTPKFNKSLNAVFSNLTAKNNDYVKGYCSNLRQLLEENHFMYSYRLIYNITQIDWPIILGKESYNSDGDIVLNSKQQKALEDILRQHITNIRILRYDYDIDVAEIVWSRHIMISDSEQKIYLVAYDKIDDYPIDEDIARGMGVN